MKNDQCLFTGILSMLPRVGHRVIIYRYKWVPTINTCLYPAMTWGSSLLTLSFSHYFCCLGCETFGSSQMESHHFKALTEGADRQ